MTDKAAIRELREKVEAAGDARPTDFAKVIPFRGKGRALNAFGQYAFRAYYHQSLDAALALHEAVLPGWFWSVAQNIHHGHFFARVTPPGDLPDHSATDSVPARALITAILKAMEND